MHGWTGEETIGGRGRGGRVRSIALGGFMGTGKSSVGAALAAQLGLPLVDTDAWVAERWGPIPDQFAQEGEAAFRARERAAIDALDDGVVRVIATGGGAWVDPANRARLRDYAHLVVLTAPLDVLAARVGGGVGRPLWDADTEARYRSRQPAYADADLHVDTHRASIEQAVEEIATWVKARR